MPIDVHKESCKRIFTASPFIIAPNWKRPAWPSVTGRTDKPAVIYSHERMTLTN